MAFKLLVTRKDQHSSAEVSKPSNSKDQEIFTLTQLYERGHPYNTSPKLQEMECPKKSLIQVGASHNFKNQH